MTCGNLPASSVNRELVANAVEHAGGTLIGLNIREHAARGGQRGVACEITDSSPALPRLRPAQPGQERGRGLVIVAALATTSGVTTRPGGKTAWFTLTTPADPGRAGRRAEPELEAGA